MGMYMCLQDRTEVSWKSCVWWTNTGNRTGLRGFDRALCSPGAGRAVLHWLGYVIGPDHGELPGSNPLCSAPSLMPCELLHHLLLVPVPCPGAELCGWCCSLSYCLTNWDSVLARVQGWTIKICSSLKSAIKLVSGEWMYLPGRRGKWAQPLIKEKVLVSVTDFSDCFIFSITFKSPHIFSCRLLTHLLEILFT